MKMSFMVLEIWSFGYGKVMEIFLKEFVQTLKRIFNAAIFLNCMLSGFLVMIYIFIRAPGNRWALDQAKRRLADSYFLVGISEEMEKFIRTLDYSLPGIFKGATKKYMKGI